MSLARQILTGMVFSCWLIQGMSVWGQLPSDQQLHNWPNWRGPLSNGIAPLGNPPVEWGEDKNIVWKIEVPGRGSATPIIWGDKVFVLTAVSTEKTGPSTAPPGAVKHALSLDAPVNYYQFKVLCYDRKTGAQLWEDLAHEAIPHEGGHATNSFASGSPTTDGERLYVSFGSFGVYCYDLNGKPLWKRDLGRMQTRAAFGEGSSPAISGNTLVVLWDHEGDSFIIALDARTGETLWKVDRDEPTSWSTPFIIEFDGRTQVVTNGTNRVRSYDLKTGELIWECGGMAKNPIPTPVSMEELIFCTTGFQGYAVYAIPLSSRGDVTDSPTIPWKRTDAGSYVSSPLLYEGQLYFTKSKDAILFSVDAQTGAEVIRQKRLQGLGTIYASPVAAAGKVYFTDRDGTTLVIKAGPNFEVLATNRLNEVIDASPAIVGDRMYLRGEKHLFCVGR